MKKWWMWLILSAIWAVAAVLNALDGRSPWVIGYDVLAAVMMAAMAFIDKAGNKKAQRWACIVTIAVLVAFVVFVVIMK